LAVVGCVSKYEDTTSDWNTFQLGEECYTVGHGDVKFNVPGMLPGISCKCTDLKLVRRIVLKAGQSPEALSCPGRHYVAEQTLPVVTVKAPADNYVPAAGQALSGAFIGAGLGAGLAAQQAAHMTQSVGGGGFGPNYISTYNAGAGAIPGLPNGR